MKQIATHKNPDADALVAAYLAATYLWSAETVEVVFVGRTPPRNGFAADCLVDVGNEYNPARLRFDHKPPAQASGPSAFRDRNETCATKLLYEFLVARGDALTHFDALVQTVWEGDAHPPRTPSPTLTLSRATGFHRAVRDLRALGGNDTVVYEGARAWLSKYNQALRAAAEATTD